MNDSTSVILLVLDVLCISLLFIDLVISMAKMCYGNKIETMRKSLNQLVSRNDILDIEVLDSMEDNMDQIQRING